MDSVDFSRLSTPVGKRKEQEFIVDGALFAWWTEDGCLFMRQHVLSMEEAKEFSEWIQKRELTFQG